MKYTQQQADKNLGDYVRCYWKIENQHKDVQYYTILPDGFFDLLICYHNNHLDGLFLSGLWDEKTNVAIAPETTIYGLQFRLLASEYIVQENISALLNTITALEKSLLQIPGSMFIIPY